MTDKIFSLNSAAIRARKSRKYQAFDADVLPLWVAEMDCALAPPITEVLAAAVQAGDAGYPALDSQLADALAAYAAEAWSWQIDPAMVAPTADVGVAMTELLRANISAGDRVVISSPVYPPFFMWVEQAAGQVVDIPLVDDGGWSLDLDGLRREFAAGAKAYLLCNPANPVGRAWSAAELQALAELAAEYDVFVMADEIHGPLALDGASFTPFLTVSDTAREVGVSVLAASKGWNVAGLKCAQTVAASDRGYRRVHGIHEHVFDTAGHFGTLASIAAWSKGGRWITQAVAELSANRDLLGELIATHLPKAGYRAPEATYLAWLDLTAYGWGDTPSRKILEEARVAVNPGPSFGAQTGRGHTRINFACSPEVLTEAMGRIGRLAALEG